MAAIVRYYAEFKDRKSISWRVEFCDKDFTGTAEEVTLGANGFTLKWNGNVEEPHQAIVTSSADFPLIVETTGVYDWLLELPNASPDRFTVAIKWGTGWSNTRWVGVLMVDGLDIEDIYLPQQVVLQANDDLARLQDVLYKAAPSAEYAGDAYIHDHIRNCLLKLRTAHHWENTDIILKVVPYFRPYQDGGYGLDNTILNHEHLYNTDSEGVQQYYSVWEVLQELVTLYGARFFLEQGQFWLQPISAFTRDPLQEKLLDVINYKKDGSTYSATDLPIFNDFSADIERIRGWNTTYLPRIKRVEREFKSGTALVIGYVTGVPHQYIPMDTGPQLVDITPNWLYMYAPTSGNAVVQAGYLPRLTFQFLTSSDAVSGLTGNDKAVRWRVDLHLKLEGDTTYYLNRTIAHTSNTTPSLLYDGTLAEVSGVEYGTPTWGTNSANKASIITTAVDGTVSYAIQELLEIDLPEVTETAIVYIRMAAHAIDADGQELDTPHAEVLYQYSGGILLFPAQGEQLTADSYLYYAEQDEGREVITLPEAILGDFVGVSTLNYLRYGTIGSTTVPTTVWEQIDESAQEPIHQLVVREILAYRAKALEIRSGLARCISTSNAPAGVLPFGYSLTEGTDLYICLGMTWHAASAQYELGLCKFDRNTAAITGEDGEVPVLGMTTDGGGAQLARLRNTTENPSTRSQQANINAALRQAMRSSERTNLGYINTDADGVTDITISSGAGGTRILTLGGNNSVNVQYIYDTLKRIVLDLDDYEGYIKAHAPIGKTTTPKIEVYQANPDSLTESTDKVGLQAPTGSFTSHTITLPKTAPASGTEVLVYHSTGVLSGLADGNSGEFITTNGSGILSWAAASGGGGGWHGSTSLLKVMPSEFIMNDDYNRAPTMVEDDTSGKLGIKAPSANTELYAFIAVPTGYKATDVQVYASASTSSAVTAYSFDQSNGSIVSKGTGNFNSAIDITDITSGSTTNVAIKLAPASTATVIYGADITITAV